MQFSVKLQSIYLSIYLSTNVYSFFLFTEGKSRVTTIFFLRISQSSCFDSMTNLPLQIASSVFSILEMNSNFYKLKFASYSIFSARKTK